MPSLTLIPSTSATPASPAISWEARVEQLRLQEWEMAQQLFAAASHHVLGILQGTAKKCAFTEITRFIDLASRLARRATGLSGRGEETLPSSHDDCLRQFEEALQQVYGEQAARSPVPAPCTQNTGDILPPPPSLNPNLTDNHNISLLPSPSYHTTISSPNSSSPTSTKSTQFPSSLPPQIAPGPAHDPPPSTFGRRGHLKPRRRTYPNLWSRA